MRKSCFSETQIVGMLKEAEAGRPASDISRENGISSATFYKWKAKYGGMEASDVRRLKELEPGHNRLKQMFAELSLENQALYVFIRLSEVRGIVGDWLKQYNAQRTHRVARRPHPI